MATKNERGKIQPTAPLVVSRVFAAPRAQVFQAWTSAHDIKRWFCPAGYSVPQAEVEFRVGGTFKVCMRSPEGKDHWTQGEFSEIVPNDRLVIDMHAIGEFDRPLFRAHTVVTLADVTGGTRLEVTQTYNLFDPSAEAMIQGAPRGWLQTLDRLEQELARITSGQTGE